MKLIFKEYVICTLLISSVTSNSKYLPNKDTVTKDIVLNHEEFDLAEGVKVEIDERDKENIINLKFNVTSLQESFQGRSGSGTGGGHGGGGGGGGGHDKKLLRRILPMFIIPFLIQSAILPMFLSMLKMMLVKSLMVGKLALLLIAFNAFRTSNLFKGRGDERLASEHYGFHGSGMEEYGAYMNRFGLWR